MKNTKKHKTMEKTQNVEQKDKTLEQQTAETKHQKQ